MKTFKLNRLLDVMYIGVILCASCSELELGDGLKTGKDAVPVSEIVLSDSEVYMKIGETKTVTSKVYPSDATDKTVVWSSRNEPVVTVENGKLTALKPGTAVICAESRNGEAQAFCIVRVLYPNPVTGVSLDKSQIQLLVGEEYTLTASVYPLDATLKSFTWTTSDSSAATVVNGKVTAVNEGKAIITVKTDDGGKTATCVVIVTTKVVVADYIDEYGINHGKGIVIGETMWAPVNCGYHATDYPYGKHYQWGRKYGQGLGDNYDKAQITVEHGGVSYEKGQDKYNSEVFYTGANSPNVYGNIYGWEYHSNDILSAYKASWSKMSDNPCPDGWRVPSKTELQSLMECNHVYEVDNVGVDVMIFLPSQYQLSLPILGCRYYSTGQLKDVDKCGYYWSRSSEWGAYEYYYLGISADGIVSPYEGFRSWGFSIRCVGK
jgi:uncharacterized protein (TIGR02145 family)